MWWVGVLAQEPSPSEQKQSYDAFFAMSDMMGPSDMSPPPTEFEGAHLDTSRFTQPAAQGLTAHGCQIPHSASCCISDCTRNNCSADEVMLSIRSSQQPDAVGGTSHIRPLGVITLDVRNFKDLVPASPLDWQTQNLLLSVVLLVRFIAVGH